MATSGCQRPRSLNNDTPTYVQFVNCTGRMIYLFWLDYKGELMRYGHIPPRMGTSMNTYVTHPWIARDASTWYPLLLNGKQIFYPEAEREGNIFHDMNRDRIDIHIPVYPLFRRCLEVVYLYFQREAIAWSNIPKDIKDILSKMSSPTEFNDYAEFDSVIYENLNEENENDFEHGGGVNGDRNDMEENDNIDNIDDDDDDDDDDVYDDASDAGGDESDEAECDMGAGVQNESDNEDYHDALEEDSKDDFGNRPK